MKLLPIGIQIRYEVDAEERQALKLFGMFIHMAPDGTKENPRPGSLDNEGYRELLNKIVSGQGTVEDAMAMQLFTQWWLREGTGTVEASVRSAHTILCRIYHVLANARASVFSMIATVNCVNS
jgi:hypothetical protein